MNIVGYFVHKDDKEINSWTAMVVIESENQMQCYTGQEGHNDIKYRGWLDELVPITKEQYLEASRLFHTPEEYIS